MIDFKAGKKINEKVSFHTTFHYTFNICYSIEQCGNPLQSAPPPIQFYLLKRLPKLKCVWINIFLRWLKVWRQELAEERNDTERDLFILCFVVVVAVVVFISFDDWNPWTCTVIEVWTWLKSLWNVQICAVTEGWYWQQQQKKKQKRKQKKKTAKKGVDDGDLAHISSRAYLK